MMKPSPNAALSNPKLFARDRQVCAYCVGHFHIDELTPGTFAKIDARFTAPNRIEVTTSGLGAFTLDLSGHPKFAADRPLELAVDGILMAVIHIAAIASIELVPFHGMTIPLLRYRPIGLPRNQPAWRCDTHSTPPRAVCRTFGGAVCRTLAGHGHDGRGL